MIQGMVTGSVPPSPRPDTDFAALEAERRFLWGVCYRMTGSSADAEDLVQETFVRALTRPPANTSEPWRPWLVRVAMNLSRDQLRRRKRRAYPGVWLPTPIETGADETGAPVEATSPEASPEARYGMTESASFAFLVAAEALSASQRAVLLLRDVFDYSSRETADMLELTEENVRITLHRARKIMASYDEERRDFSPATVAAVEATLHQVVACIASRDLSLARELFAPGARSIGDGGGVFHVSPRPVSGAEKILKIYGKLGTRSSPDVEVEIRRINGLPALVVRDPAPKRPNAPRAVIVLDMDASGRIRTMYSVLAPDKLGAVTWAPRRAASA